MLSGSAVSVVSGGLAVERLDLLPPSLFHHSVVLSGVVLLVLEVI